MRFIRSLLFITTLILIARPSAAQSNSSALSTDLQSVKAALSKYSDPLVAVRDGYFSTVACVDFPKGAKEGSIEYPPGAMGVHFLNTANIGPALDPAKPQILIYEPVGDKLVLTAAEWFMPEQIAGGKAPTIFGQTLYGPMDGHEPIIPAALRHYDLHVWLWKNNPAGTFVSTNKAVKCSPKARYTIAYGADAMVHHH